MKILIADSDHVSRACLSLALTRLGQQVEEVEDGQKAWEAYRKGRHQMIICDWVMPGIDGPSLCRLVRGEPTKGYCYIILLIAKTAKGYYEEGLGAGADDFLTKPFDEDQLATRLHAAQRLLALQEERRSVSLHDSPAGLWDRGAILEHLDREIDRARRAKAPIAVLLVEVDRFKWVNERHGQAVGNIVLREVAVRTQLAVRSYDLIGRYGPKEFLVVLPGCNEANAFSVAERVRGMVRSTPVKTPAGPLHVTVSLGVAACRDRESFLKAAEAALTEAKRLGVDHACTASNCPGAGGGGVSSEFVELSDDAEDRREDGAKER